MYASAMKFCGAMELCAIGYPTGESTDFHWPAVMMQATAQEAGMIVAFTRGHKPQEAEFMIEKQFAPVYQFKNPRTGTVATLWVLDLTKSGEFKTELPPQIVVQARGAPASLQAPSTARDIYAETERYGGVGPVAGPGVSELLSCSAVLNAYLDEIPQVPTLAQRFLHEMRTGATGPGIDAVSADIPIRVDPETAPVYTAGVDLGSTSGSI